MAKVRILHRLVQAVPSELWAEKLELERRCDEAEKRAGHPLPRRYRSMYCQENSHIRVTEREYESFAEYARMFEEFYDNEELQQIEAERHKYFIIEIVSHKGGYTPFEADITEYVRAGDDVRLTVRADNILTFQTIPPGNIVNTRSGKKQSFWHDFFNYSGIHRPVWIYYKPESYIEDITVTTDFEGSTGIVKYKVVQKCKDSYGTDTLAGLTAVVSDPWTEEYQVEFLRMYHKVFDQIEAVVGEHVWNFADFATVAGITRVGGNKKGVFTRNRKPKMAAYELRKRWRGI